MNTALEDTLTTFFELLIPLLSIPVISLFVVGLLTALFQAITQLQDAAVAAAPKLIVIALLTLFFGTQIGELLTEQLSGILHRIPQTANRNYTPQ